MELRDILHEVFPVGTISRCRQVSFEVRGLPAGCEPKRCAVLARGKPRRTQPGERREHYLVCAHDVMMHLRICSGDVVHGYAEFAEGLDVAYTAEGQDKLAQRARASIAQLGGLRA